MRSKNRQRINKVVFESFSEGETGYKMAMFAVKYSLHNFTDLLFQMSLFVVWTERNDRFTDYELIIQDLLI